MPLDEDMRKLKFTVDAEKYKNSSVEDTQVDTQVYVVDLLSKQLGQYGFNTAREPDDHLAITVEDHPIKIGVNCNLQTEDGHYVCEISAHADEQQPWFQRIETQSVIKQLSQAVEDTLKDDEAFQSFEWKG